MISDVKRNTSFDRFPVSAVSVSECEATFTFGALSVDEILKYEASNKFKVDQGFQEPDLKPIRMLGKNSVH